MAFETNLVSITPSKSKWTRKQTYPPGRDICRRLLVVSRSWRFWLWRSIKQEGIKSRSSIEGSEHKQYWLVIFLFLSSFRYLSSNFRHFYEIEKEIDVGFFGVLNHRFRAQFNHTIVVLPRCWMLLEVILTSKKE
jgi:hypothetical protein